MQDRILVLCRNRSLAGLISRTLRYRQIYSLPIPFETPASEVLARAPRGVIVASDAMGADALDGFDFSLLTSQTPILALGGAVGVLCRHFGGAAGPAACARGSVTLGLASDPLFQDVASGEHVLHGLCELTLPDGLSALATANERPIGFKHAALPLYALQYPIERNDPDSASSCLTLRPPYAAVPPPGTRIASLIWRCGACATPRPRARCCAPFPAAWIAPYAPRWPAWPLATG